MYTQRIYIFPHVTVLVTGTRSQKIVQGKIIQSQGPLIRLQCTLMQTVISDFETETRHLWPYLRIEQVKECFARFDTNSDGRISFTEFVKFYNWFLKEVQKRKKELPRSLL